MTKKAKIILLSISLGVIMLISVVLFKLASGGFQFLTYVTENYLEVQLEDFLSRDSGQGSMRI